MSTSLLIPRGYDETHAECVERAQRALDCEFKPQPLDHDAHVTAWRIAVLGRARRTRLAAKIEIKLERDRLREAISTHRSQKADDRCVEDDDRLYATLGDGVKCDRRVGDKAAMLENCQRFIAQRCDGGGWPSYAELEKQLAATIADRDAWNNSFHAANKERVEAVAKWQHFSDAYDTAEAACDENIKRLTLAQLRIIRLRSALTNLTLVGSYYGTSRYADAIITANEALGVSAEAQNQLPPAS